MLLCAEVQSVYWTQVGPYSFEHNFSSCLAVLSPLGKGPTACATSPVIHGIFSFIKSFIIMKRAKDQFSCFYFVMTSVDDENDIPGSVLDTNKLSSYRVDELKFWLSCRGDTLKNLSTKAACIQRYFK